MICFMAKWREFAAFFQAFYFFAMMAVVQASTLYVLVLHYRHGKQRSTPKSSLFYLEFVMIASMIPSNLLTYRARLFTMEIMKKIKRNHVDAEGIGYDSTKRKFNFLFCCRSYYKQSYDQYLLFRSRNADKFSLQALYVKVVAILFLVTTQFYRKVFTDALAVPSWYIPLLFLLEFQKLACFFVKLMFFWPVFFVHRVLMHIRLTRSNKGQQQVQTVEQQPP